MKRRIKRGTEEPAILHIDTEKYWRGGQQQTVNLHHQLLRTNRKSLLVCPPQSKTEEFCRQNNIPVIPLKMRNEADIIAALKISSIVKKENVLIIVAHTAQALSLAIPAVTRSKSCKLIAVRRVDFHVGQNTLSRWKYSTVLLTHIVAVSEAIKKILISDNIPKEKISVIYDGIDINKFKKSLPADNLREQLNIPDKHIVVGTVAALVGHKDYPNLLNAAKLALDRNKQITFIAVGSGDDKKKLVELHSELGLGDNFIFTGFQKDVGQYFKLFDIFVLPSKTEGLGSSLLDAMAMNLPLIGTNTGGIPELIENNKNGLLVEKENSRALADAIIKLADNDELRKYFAEEGLKWVQYFSVENITKQYEMLFDEIIKE